MKEKDPTFLLGRIYEIALNLMKTKVFGGSFTQETLLQWIEEDKFDHFWDRFLYINYTWNELLDLIDPEQNPFSDIDND